MNASNNTLHDNAYGRVKQICTDFIAEKYGDHPPKEITARLEKELSLPTAIKFADILLTSALMVKAAAENGEITVLRGCTASSLISYCLGITKNNPLPAHYYCPVCKRVEWVSSADSGYDLPESTCRCGGEMQGDGLDLCYQSFFGFSGDKIPDIPMNFSKNGKGIVVDALKNKIVGKDRLLWASSPISGDDADDLIVDKDALLIIPKGKSASDFSPLQKERYAELPVAKRARYDLRDDLYCCNIYDFDFVERLKRLAEKTGISAYENTPLDGAELIKLIKSDDLHGITAFQDIPEALKSIDVSDFTDLAKLLGLCFRSEKAPSTYQTLLKNKSIRLREVPAYREDIFFDLINRDVSDEDAFRCMETVRKGLIARNRLPDGEMHRFETVLQSAGLPDWYLDFCKNSLYLFPKAHGTEYTRIAVIEAFYKTHFREIFEEVTASASADK